ncbi:uncharacterized protein LOC112272424 [Brachypodium distachyon]|uniref:Uncharacterized protein n=1 Tax=Brachypodium distachyon TaxID=15368 RepID=A0A0Q3HWE7_BRADI|nr:uncharacterized protein LOC112272424 [Brachypodium distachyon]KQJ92603.1 hypothetical protein BRADI_4g44704v3 [Brachypodium distachyon]|eukprot:XP_024318917.1 uncharacterized protein LOC112272424 [Brachypodium distachyon]
MGSEERSPKQQQINGGGEGRTGKKKERLLDFLRAEPAPTTNSKGGAFLARVATLRTRAAARLLRERRRAVDWRGLRRRAAAWARHPMNAALLAWLAFVAGGVGLVFLLMVGALDGAVPEQARRRRWAEVANQMLNALFTVMCVYQHPQLCHHLALLLRWRAPGDPAELRAVYRKNAGAGEEEEEGALRNERAHVAVVVALLHGTCLAQYASCALFWLLRPGERPAWAVNLAMGLGLAFPVAAGLYSLYGPLKARPPGPDPAAAGPVADEEKAAMATAGTGRRRRKEVGGPEWAGGLLAGLGDDPAAAAMSACCGFCVFGWNMERLGLGNMYVHVFTFALLCAAPLLVFAGAALSIARDDADHAGAAGELWWYLAGAAGALLSVLGLAYGGFWRSRMRRRFGLPAEDELLRCAGGRIIRCPAADYGKWLLCAPCALAQEVRTGNLYDVEGGSFYAREEEEEEEEEKPAMAPLEREGSLGALLAGECAVAVDMPPEPARVNR